MGKQRPPNKRPPSGVLVLERLHGPAGRKPRLKLNDCGSYPLMKRSHRDTTVRPSPTKPNGKVDSALPDLFGIQLVSEFWKRRTLANFSV